MEYVISQLPLVLILCVGIFVQSAAGFAAGLLIVPAMLWCGYSIPEAQCSLLVATIPQNIWGVWSLRDAVSFKQVAWPGVARVLFLPLGALTLMALETLDQSAVRQVVGGLVLAATVAIMVFRPKPQERLKPIWGIIAFPISGFFQGLVGMGGPAMVFWVQAHDWGTRQMRAFLFLMYLLSMVPAMFVLLLFFHDRIDEIVHAGLVAALLIPLLFFVTFFGLKAGTWLGRTRLRRVSLWLLLLMGVAGLAAPLISPG